MNEHETAQEILQHLWNRYNKRLNQVKQLQTSVDTNSVLNIAIYEKEAQCIGGSIIAIKAVANSMGIELENKGEE